MVCPTCGLDNDPSAAACARCNTTMGAEPPPGPSPPAYPRPPRNQLPRTAVLSAAALSVVVLLALVVVVYRNGRPDEPVAAPAATAPVRAVPTTTGQTTQETTTTEPTADSAPDPLPQAEVIDALLDRSVSSRAKLIRANDRVGRCTGLSGALDDLRAVGDERRSQIAEAQNADLSALPNGEAIRSTLVAALQHSLDADEAYVEWAEAAVSSGCANTADRQAAYARGESASDDAGTAKLAFLAEWNPVAGQLGLATRSRQKI